MTRTTIQRLSLSSIIAAIHSSMRIYSSERRSRRYVEQDDEEGFPRGGSTRAKGQAPTCHSPTRSADSLTCLRTCRKTSPPVCHHYARRPYKSRPAYRGRLRRRLELTWQSFEFTPETTPPIVGVPTMNLFVLQVLPKTFALKKPSLVTTLPDQFRDYRFDINYAVTHRYSLAKMKLTFELYTI